MSKAFSSLEASYLRAAADKAQDFYPIAFLETAKLKVLTVKNFQIQLHGNPLRFDVEFAQQIADGRAGSAIAPLPIDLNLHPIGHRASSYGTPIPIVNKVPLVQALPVVQ
jgi:hypothetical protein